LRLSGITKVVDGSWRSAIAFVQVLDEEWAAANRPEAELKTGWRPDSHQRNLFHRTGGHEWSRCLMPGFAAAMIHAQEQNELAGRFGQQQRRS
jgi:hypothetical protein